jgi:hypothetical protein
VLRLRRIPQPRGRSGRAVIERAKHILVERHRIDWHAFDMFREQSPPSQLRSSTFPPGWSTATAYFPGGPYSQTVVKPRRVRRSHHVAAERRVRGPSILSLGPRVPEVSQTNSALGLPSPAFGRARNIGAGSLPPLARAALQRIRDRDPITLGQLQRPCWSRSTFLQQSRHARRRRRLSGVSAPFGGEWRLRWAA